MGAQPAAAPLQAAARHAEFGLRWAARTTVHPCLSPRASRRTTLTRGVGGGARQLRDLDEEVRRQSGAFARRRDLPALPDRNADGHAAVPWSAPGWHDGHG